jgi:hypothetical protein
VTSSQNVTQPAVTIVKPDTSTITITRTETRVATVTRTQTRPVTQTQTVTQPAETVTVVDTVTVTRLETEVRRPRERALTGEQETVDGPPSGVAHLHGTGRSVLLRRR